jgi:anti-repressor protein
LLIACRRKSKASIYPCTYSVSCNGRNSEGYTEAFLHWGFKMNELTLNSNVSTMSTIEIAELTGKRHDHVLRDTRNMLIELHGEGAPNFGDTYIHPQNNEEYKIYRLPKREALILTTGYSIIQRAAIIDRWQELEAKQVPVLPNYQEALRQLADSLDKNAQLENKITEDAPKVEFAMAVRRMDGACKVGDFAKVIGIGRNSLFAKLRLDQILMVDNMPYQKYVDSGYFVVIEQIPYVDHAGKAHPAFTTMITGKGQVFLERKYRVEA